MDKKEGIYIDHSAPLNINGSATIKLRKLALELRFFDKSLYTLPDEPAFKTSLQQFIWLYNKHEKTRQRDSRL